MTRKLKSDGREDTMQMLHNLNESMYMLLAFIPWSSVLGWAVSN